VLPDWSQAGRLSAWLRHALIALCLYGVTGGEPSLEEPDAAPRGVRDHAATDSLRGYPVPINILLLRKAFLTLDGIARQVDPDFKCLAGNSRVCLRGASQAK
jgi:hypothetical protein